jgi:predicted transcriptional regulator
MEAKMTLVADVLKAVSDSKSLELFRIIALTKPDTDILISKTRLTRKQCYSRISRLMKAGLIKRKNGNYTLTAFGKVIYDITLVTIENAVSNYWKLKAIDSLEMSKDLPAEDHKKIIDSLIDNQEIKAVFVSDNKVENQTYTGARHQQRIRQLKPELLVH